LGGTNVEDFALDAQLVARPYRLGPPHLLEAGADNSPGRPELTVDQQPHGQSGRMPAAGCEAAENRISRGIIIEMKRLGIELRGESLDLIGINAQSDRHEPLPDREVIEVAPVHDCLQRQDRLAAAHGSPSSCSNQTPVATAIALPRP